MTAGTGEGLEVKVNNDSDEDARWWWGGGEEMCQVRREEVRES